MHVVLLWEEKHSSLPYFICHPERSEGSGARGSEILRCAQDDRAVLPAAPWPTRAHVRLRLMGIRADKSAMRTINRRLQSFWLQLFHTSWPSAPKASVLPPLATTRWCKSGKHSDYLRILNKRTSFLIEK